jgi:hypothetical protein
MVRRRPYSAKRFIAWQRDELLIICGRLHKQGV